MVSSDHDSLIAKILPKGITSKDNAAIQFPFPHPQFPFIMKKETKENVQIISAIAMLIGGFLLAVAGFIVPPTGQIHESVLGIFAECLIYAGSIFGVTIYIQTKYSELRSYLDSKLKEEQPEKNKTIHFD